MTEREELEMWKKMYMRMLRGLEEAIDTLIQAERACEEVYISADPSHNDYGQETQEASGVRWQCCEIIGEPERRGYLLIPRTDVN